MAPITFIVTSVYKLFVVKLVETLIFFKRKTWMKYSWSAILNGLHGLGQIRPLELSSFIFALWSSGWLSGWMIHFLSRNMWCSLDCLTITLWGLWYNLTKWCLRVINSFLMKCYCLVNIYFAGKHEPISTTCVDQSNYSRVPKRVSLIMEGWQVLLTVEGYWQRVQMGMGLFCLSS